MTINIDNFWLNFLSIAIGITGVALAVYEAQSKSKLEKVLKSQIVLMLTRVRVLAPWAHSIRTDIKKYSTPANSNMNKYLWTQYQGINDLYTQMVGYYLQYESSFTYTDLKTMIDNDFINSHWQEEVWRSLMVHRPENREAPVPDYYISNFDNRKKTGNSNTQKTGKYNP